MWFQRKKDQSYSKVTSEQLTWFAALIQYMSSTICLVKYKFRFRRFVVKGREHLPARTANFVVASTHTSDLDPPVMSVAMNFRPISYMAKQELFQSAIGALYYSTIGSFAVNRDKLELATIKSALTVLKKPGWLLGIFPEGTRNTTGKVGEAKRGVAFIANSAKVGIMPMAIVRKKYDPSDETKEDLLVQLGEIIPYDKNKSVDDLTQEIQLRMIQLTEQASLI